MKVNELRVGNILEWNKENFNVCVIYNDKIENELYCKHLSELHPVELTEEWLLWFGFIKELDGVFSKYRNNYKSDTSKVSIQWVDYSATGESYSGYVFFYGKFYDGDFIWINHVHQLQNLYYLITGKEL
jgi:hypothetical protein